MKMKKELDEGVTENVIINREDTVCCLFLVSTPSAHVHIVVRRTLYQNMLYFLQFDLISDALFLRGHA